MYKIILVPLDGSELSECGLSHVKAIAGGLNVPDVVLFMVYEPLPRSQLAAYTPSDFFEKAEQDGKKYAQEYLSKKANELRTSGINATIAFDVGNPAEKILDYARKNGADLIIMSTHGRSGVARWAMGSVADKVLRHSVVPVLTVAPGVCRIA
jgi:nucleotide-binding universal stress UspA family protein